MKIINKIIDTISYDSRRKRSLEKTKKYIDEYMEMSDEEFMMDYIEVCSRYEHKKLTFTAIFIGIMISIIMNTWTYFYDFLVKLMVTENSVVKNVINQVTVFALIIMLLIFIVTIWILYDMAKTLYMLNKRKIFLDEIKDMRKNGKY